MQFGQCLNRFLLCQPFLDILSSGKTAFQFLEYGRKLIKGKGYTSKQKK